MFGVTDCKYPVQRARWSPFYPSSSTTRRQEGVAVAVVAASSRGGSRARLGAPAGRRHYLPNRCYLRNPTLHLLFIPPPPRMPPASRPANFPPSIPFLCHNLFSLDLCPRLLRLPPAGTHPAPPRRPRPRGTPPRRCPSACNQVRSPPRTT